MLVVVSQAGAVASVGMVLQQDTTTTTEASTKNPPNPILPTGKEIVWAIGTFAVLLVLMRYWLYPRLKRGMDERYARIESQLAEAEETRTEVEAELTEYQVAIAQVRTEANQRLDAARAELEHVRQARLGEVNNEISAQRAQAAASAEAARQVAMVSVEGAVAEVAANAAQRALGVPIDPEVARRAAQDVVEAGAQR